jgi:ankyrin repeat protein
MDLGPENRYSGTYALHTACRTGNVTTTEDLLARGAYIQSQDNRGFSPLHTAAYAGQEQIVQLLLKRGASPVSIDFDRRTPLHRAVQEAHENVVCMLIAAGNESLDVQDVYGLTPLHLAVRVASWDAKGMHIIIQALLSAGADPWAKSFSGKQAIDEATAVGDQALVNTLRRALDPDYKPLASPGNVKYVKISKGLVTYHDRRNESLPTDTTKVVSSALSMLIWGQKEVYPRIQLLMSV